MSATVARLAYRYGLLVVLVGLVVFFSATKPRFHEWDNALIIFQSVAIVAIVALGVTVSMAAGGFDLSVGANVSFVVMVTALVMIRYDLSGVAAIIAGLSPVSSSPQSTRCSSSLLVCPTSSPLSGPCSSSKASP